MMTIMNNTHQHNNSNSNHTTTNQNKNNKILNIELWSTDDVCDWLRGRYYVVTCSINSHVSFIIQKY